MRARLAVPRGLIIGLLLLLAAVPAAAFDEFFEPGDWSVLAIEKVGGKPFVARIRNAFTGRAFDYVPGDAVGPTVIREVTETQVVLEEALTKKQYFLPVPKSTLDRQFDEKARDRHKVLFDEARRLFKIGQSKSAAGQLKEALTLNPGFKDAHFLLGIIYHENRLYKDAFRQYREVVTIDPKNFRAFYNLAQLFSETGNFNESLYYLRKALAVKPDYEKALNLYSSVQDEIDRAKKSSGSMLSMQEREAKKEKLKADMQKVADEIRQIKGDLEEIKIEKKTDAETKARKETLEAALLVKTRLYEFQSKQLEQLLAE